MKSYAQFCHASITQRREIVIANSQPSSYNFCMTDAEFRFFGPIVQHDIGILYNVIWLPDDFHAQLPLKKHPRLRIHAEINGVLHNGAWVPSRGRWYLLLSKAELKKRGLAVGDGVEVVFTIADQNHVDVPTELDDALDEDPFLRLTWQNLTAGKRRGLAYRVASAKTAPTKAKRVTEVIRTMRGF